MTTYRFDASQSAVSITGTSSVHPIHMRSQEPEGELTIGDSLSGSLVIPVKTLRTGQPLQDLELRRQIQARRHPNIEATLLTVTSVDGDTYEVTGEVTFMGVTQPNAGTLTVTRGDGTIAISGESTFDVRDFAFRPPNILGVKVDPVVTVTIALVGITAT